MQSDTWALASPDVRPWLLMLWTVAWQQVPCGSMPSSDELIAARLGMKPAAFKKHKDVLMRGWTLADDGRLYHDTISERVLDMLGRKESERKRKADYRARMDAERKLVEANAASSAGQINPEMSHGTGAGQTRESTGCDATGTGTGTGTGLDKSREEPPSAQEAELGGSPLQGATRAGWLCKRLRSMGVQSVNPSNPRLLTLLEAGATDAEFTAMVPASQGKGDPFAYILGAVEGERRRAKATAGAIHRGALPNKQEAIEIANRSVAMDWVAEMRGQK